MDHSQQDEFLMFLDENRQPSILPKGLNAYLVNKESKEEINIRQARVFIGRKNCDVNIVDDTVSEKHATIGFFDGFFFLIDLKSKNKTFLNNQNVVESILCDGDEIQIGSVSLIFHVSGTVDTGHSIINAKSPTVGQILGVMFETDTDTFFDETQIAISDKQAEVAQASLVEIVLHQKTGSNIGRVVKFLQSEVLIGRGHGDLPVKDADVSKKHAVIETFGTDQVFIKDLDSTNGTFVNGKKTKRAQIGSGDEIKIGNTEFLLKVGDVHQPTKKRMPSECLVKLKVVSGQMLGKVFDVGAGTWIIGSENVDINIKDSWIEKRHAKLKIAPERYALEDLSVKSGTFVNKKKVQKCVISSGDLITLGRSQIKIETLGEDDQSVTSALAKVGLGLK